MTARTFDARAAVYMGGSRLAEAKISIERANKFFIQWKEQGSHEYAAKSKLANYIWAHIEMQATSLDVQFLEIENKTQEDKMDEDGIHGPHKHACALELVRKLAEEQVLWEKLKFVGPIC